MTNRTIALLLRGRWLLVAGLPVLVALWWAFRPEKLWINQRVNEPAPFSAGGDPQPILTGRFDGKEHQTSGRATIYKRPDGVEYLRLNDFTTQNGADVEVMLARSGDPDPQRDAKGGLDSINVGPLKSNQGDQNYDLPAAVDLNKYKAVVIYCEGLHSVCGRAELEPF
jgi:hypothetical protein